jgi:hypothetical protein
VALGREAIVAGYTVLFTPAMTLVARLAKAHADGRLDERLGHYAKPKPLIIDELGCLPFEPNAAHLFFQLVSRHYERGSIPTTSNRAVGEWGTVVWRPCRRDRHPRSPAAPRPRADHPWRQLSAARKTSRWPAPEIHRGGTGGARVNAGPHLPKRGVVLATVTHAARRLRRWPAAMPDGGCARRLGEHPAGTKKRPASAEQRNMRGSVRSARGSVPRVVRGVSFECRWTFRLRRHWSGYALNCVTGHGEKRIGG